MVALRPAAGGDSPLSGGLVTSAANTIEAPPPNWPKGRTRPSRCFISAPVDAGLPVGLRHLMLMVLTLAASIVTFSSTNVLQDAVHLILFGAYLLFLCSRVEAVESERQRARLPSKKSLLGRANGSTVQRGAARDRAMSVACMGGESWLT